MPLRDLIIKGQEMGLNVQDTVEIVANLQPDMVPSNIMAKMNAPAMVGDPYTAPRVGFEEAVIDYGVQEEPPTSIFQEQKQYFGPEFDYQADDVDMDEMMPDPITYTYDLPKIGQSSSGLPGNTNMKATNQTGTGSMSMSDIINTNLQASQAEAGELGEGGIAPSGPKIFPPMHGDPLPPPINQQTDSPPRPMHGDPRRIPPPLMDPVYGQMENQNSRPPRVIDIEPQVRIPPTPVNFSYGDTQTGMMDAAATLRSPFTSSIDRQAAQDYMSGIVSNIRLPF